MEKQLGGGLGADASDTGDFIGGVAAEGFEVGDLLGKDAHPFDDLAGANPRQLAASALRGEDDDLVVYELVGVTIGG